MLRFISISRICCVVRVVSTRIETGELREMMTIYIYKYVMMNNIVRMVSLF